MAKPYAIGMTLIALLAAPFASQAGTAISMDFNDQGDVVEQVLYVADGKIAIAPSNANGRFVFDAASDLITVVNHEDQTFYKLTPADIESALGLAQVLSGQAIGGVIDSQIESLPADQQAEARQLLEALGVQSAPKKVEASVLQTGKILTVNGMNCEIFVIREGEQQLGEACMSDAEALGIPTEDWQTYNQFIEMSWKFFTPIAELANRFGQSVPNLGREKIDGIPVRYVDVNDASRPLIELKAIQSGAIPADLLTIPDGYRQARLPSF